MQSTDHAVMTFVWPGHASKAAYSKAKAKTQDASKHLVMFEFTFMSLTGEQVRLINALHMNGQRVVVIGHSLGCRVAMLALLELEQPVLSRCELTHQYSGLPADASGTSCWL